MSSAMFGGGWAEEALSYWLYPTGEAQVTLEEVLAKACSLSAGYLWHHQGFRLTEKDGVFSGRSRYSENIEDEWFLVSLLRQLTLALPLAAQVRDADGELLLIEAAEALPRWVRPDATDHRVWLYKGLLHLVPPAGKSNSLSRKAKPPAAHLPESVATPHEGLSLVLENKDLTRGPPKLQEAIQQRLKGYHDEDRWRVREQVHRTVARVPARLAAVLRALPQSVAPAVRAFYARDALDIKACRELRVFGAGLSASTPATLPCSVTLTRALYAMVAQSALAPDKRCPVALGDKDEEGYEEKLLGLKLTYAYEILCSRAREQGGGAKTGRDKDWTSFRDSLAKHGFFRGEVEGSALHQQLDAQAKDFFKASLLPQLEEVGVEAASGMEVLERLSMIDASSSLEELCKEAAARPVHAVDSDAWLHELPEGLNGEAAKPNGAAPPTNGTSSSNGKRKKRRKGKKRPSEPDGEAVVSGVKKFLAGSGEAAEGAELPEAPAARPREPMEEGSGDEEGLSDFDSVDEEELEGEELRELSEFADTMRGYMGQMDAELQGSSLSQSFARHRGGPKGAGPSRNGRKSADSIDLEDDDFRAVDIDHNLVSNILTGYREEQGQGGGAATALLRSLSIRGGKEPPPLDSDDDDYEPGI